MSTVLENDFEYRNDLFELSDKTALVCVDTANLQRHTVEGLSMLEYKINTGLFIEDILLKLQTHNYDVVIVLETFNSSTLATNPILLSLAEIPQNLRRRQLIVLIGPSFHTDSDMEAWANSVDLVVNPIDVPILKQILPRAAQRTQSFYDLYIETLQAAGME